MAELSPDQKHTDLSFGSAVLGVLLFAAISGALLWMILPSWANELGLSNAVGLLDQTLAEEKKTDATLTEIAESVVNQEAEAA